MNGRRRFYGIAEIAEALGIDRQLVTVWRRRSSHGMPPPDEELSSGPLWTAETIAPWIATTRARLEAEAAGSRSGTPSPALIRQAVRRLFRLVALLLEDVPRTEVVRRAVHALGGWEAPLAAADAGRRGMAELLGVVRTAARLAEDTNGPADTDDLLAEALHAVPHAIRLLHRAEHA